MIEKIYIKQGWTPDLLEQDAFNNPIDDLIVLLKAKKQEQNISRGTQSKRVRKEFIELANKNLENII